MHARVLGIVRIGIARFQVAFVVLERAVDRDGRGDGGSVLAASSFFA
jgi:hypothetical protein